MGFYHPFSPEIIENPHPVYRRLREEAPVYFLEAWDTFAEPARASAMASATLLPLSPRNGATATFGLAHAGTARSRNPTTRTRIRTFVEDNR